MVLVALLLVVPKEAELVVLLESIVWVVVDVIVSILGVIEAVELVIVRLVVEIAVLAVVVLTLLEVYGIENERGIDLISTVLRSVRS